MSFDNIPEILRRPIQWCCWRYEQTSGPKPTKVPYNPRTGKHASSTDPQTWCSFDQAVSALAGAPGVYAGIGFFFTDGDDFCGVDLDDPYALKADGTPAHADPEAIKARQQKIFAELNSYSELSPSGKGLHIIVEASIPSGRKRDGVEVYSSKRFFTMTGNVYHNAPIADRQEIIDVLWGEMGTVSEQSNGAVLGDLFERQTDQEIFDQASAAKNGDLFLKLWHGDWSDYAPNSDGSASSEADFALVDIIAFYTQNRLQIERMFLASALGKRAKYKRRQLIGYMVNKSFDRMLPPIDLEVLINQVNSALAVPPHGPSAPAAATAAPLRADVLTGRPPASTSPKTHDGFNLNVWLEQRPTGIIGAIAQYIYASSPLPVYEISLVGALGFFSGIVGRQYNASATGLNQYLMLVTETGKGKEAISGGIGRIVAALSAEMKVAKDLRGPAFLSSGQALLKYLAGRDAPCFVSLLGEFGIRLKQITSSNASPADQTLRMVLLDLYNKSGAGNSVEPSVYADKQNNTEAVHSPALTLIGESTGERFYEALDEENVREGLVPRFTIVEYSGPRVDFNYQHANVPVPQQLLQTLSALLLSVHKMADTGTVLNIAVEPVALDMLRYLEKYIQTIINSDRAPVMKDVWNRVQQKVYRLAGLLAVSENPHVPTITEANVSWAQSLVITDTLRMLKKFEAGEMGTRNVVNDQEEYIRREVVKYLSKDIGSLPKSVDPALHYNKVISRSYLQSRVITLKPFRNEKNPTFAFNNAIKQLLDNGLLRQLNTKELATFTKKTGFHFVVTDMQWLTG